MQHSSITSIFLNRFSLKGSMRFNPEEREPFYEDRTKPVRIFVDTSDGIDAYRVVLGKGVVLGKENIDQVYIPRRIFEEVCDSQMDDVQMLHRLKLVSSDIRSTLITHGESPKYLQEILRNVRMKRQLGEQAATDRSLGRSR